MEPPCCSPRRSTALRSAIPARSPFPAGASIRATTAPLAGAARGAEEIGLSPAHVAPLGYLDLYLTTSGFRVVPVVALIAPGFALTLNPAEVDEAFECPLAFLMDPANHRRETGMARRQCAALLRNAVRGPRLWA